MSQFITFALTVCVICCWIICNAEMRFYNHVYFSEHSSFDDLVDEFVDPNTGLLNINLFLGVASPECMHLLEAPAFRGVQRIAGKFLKLLKLCYI